MAPDFLTSTQHRAATKVVGLLQFQQHPGVFIQKDQKAHCAPELQGNANSMRRTCKPWKRCKLCSHSLAFASAAPIAVANSWPGASVEGRCAAHQVALGAPVLHPMQDLHGTRPALSASANARQSEAGEAIFDLNNCLESHRGDEKSIGISPYVRWRFNKGGARAVSF